MPAAASSRTPPATPRPTPAASRPPAASRTPPAAARYGAKIRALRAEHRLTQAQLAEQLGMSPSYLNLIENDRRALPAGVLIKLAQRFKLQVQHFAPEAESRLLVDLQEALSDPLFESHERARDDLAQWVQDAPEQARAMRTLYRAYRASRATADSLAAKLAHGEDAGAMASANLPSEEVSDLLQRAGNYFGALEAAADRLLAPIGAEPRLADVYATLVARARDRYGVRIEYVRFAAERPLLRRYDPSSRTLQLSELLPTRARTFQLAHQLGLLCCGELLTELTARAPELTSDEARALARIALANYFAGAVMMPYGAFLAAARSERYDIDTLARKFRVSFEQVCHRLTTLRRPGASGVPFHLLRIDAAGNLSKRFSASGIHFARYAGACPKWNVFAALQTPGMIRVQISRMTDGQQYFCLARTVHRDPPSYHAQVPVMAIGLGCRIEHARELVYADGVALDGARAVPVGITCRLCERTDCEQRAFPSLRAKLSVDENERGPSLYAASDAVRE